MKRVSSLLVALVLFSCFCFASPIVITVLDNKDNTESSAVSDTQNIWDKFEENHPDIIIKREAFYSNSYRQRLEDYIEKGEMPDVFYAWPDTASYDIHNKGLAKDLMPLIKRDGLLDSYESIFVDPKNMEGNYLSVLPLSMTVNGLLFCNKVFLDIYGFTPATTYEELKEQCDFFNSNGITPIIMSCEYDGDVAYNLLSLVLGRIAGPNWAKDIILGNSKFTDAPFLTSLEMIQKMFMDGIFSLDAFKTADYSAFETFVGEGSPYILADHQFAHWFNPELYNNEELVNACVNAQMGMDIIPFPTIPNEKYTGSYPSSFKNGYAMNSNIESGSEKEEACWELIKWLSGSEVQQYLLDTTSQYPSLKEGVSFENLPPLDILMADIPNRIETMTPIFPFEFANNFTDCVSDGIKSMAYGNATPIYVAQVLQDLLDNETYYDRENGTFDLTLYEDDENIEEEDPNDFTVLKEIKSDLLSMMYSIRLYNNGEYTVYISDELDEDYIVIITDDVNDAFNIVYTIEQELENNLYDNFLSTLKSSDAPVKSVIKMINNKTNYGVKSWKQFADTNEFYFQWDIREE